MEDYLELALDLALNAGCKYAEARYQTDYYETNLLKNGIPEVSSFSTKKGIGMRVLIDGGLGFAATNQLNKREIRSLVKRVVSSTKRASKLRRGPIEMAETPASQGKVEVKTRIAFDSVSLEGRIDLLKETDAEALDAADQSNVKLPGRFLSLDTHMTEKLVITSDGGRVYSRIPRVELFMLLTALSTEKGSVQRFLSLGSSSGWEGVERWDLPSVSRKEVTTLGKVLNQATGIRSGEYDLILGPEVVGIVSHESSGHPGEADRVLGREAAQAGETYLDEDSIGRKVGSEVVNVVEDPTIPKSFGYYLFDDECIKARKRYLIKEGRIHEFLHNRETARVFGVESNGSSRSVSFDREPIVRMSNTFVEKGDHQLEELIEDVKDGLFIKNFMEWNIDDRRFNQRYVGLESYRIEKGEIKGLVKNPVIEITTTGLWSSIDAVGKEVEYFSGDCGKGDPMQAMPVWMGGPPVRLRNVRLGGSS
ncbi:MAG: TldD/PmbA family protein [Methanomassiliicoccales archaeon]|nr:TldD/PmbA family protein [Methanomassiliicoccales archaeon]